jgi:hypothetical protein
MKLGKGDTMKRRLVVLVTKDELQELHDLADRQALRFGECMRQILRRELDRVRQRDERTLQAETLSRPNRGKS